LTLDYFANYKRRLESYEAILSVKIAALPSLVTAVANDWESARKKRALMRLDETQAQVNEFLKKNDQTASVSEAINLLPGDLPRLYNTVWKFLAILTGDSVPRPATKDDLMISSFFRRPEVASLLARTLEKVRKQIETTPIPADMKATVYVDQRFKAELNEAFRSGFSSSQ
jgi:hypothetical protein